MPLFRGLSAFPITPAAPDGRVALDDLAGLLQRLVEAGVDSVGLLGSTGTYPYLTRSERMRTIRAAVDVVAGRAPVIVGVGALRTDEAATLARDAAEAGADGLLLAPMSYLPLTEEEVFHHFVAVASATALPLCIYDNPGTTHFTFSTGLVARLSAVPRIVALKSPAPPPADVPAHVEALRGSVPAHFAIGYSVDWHAAAAVLAGGDAWYSVLGGVLPHPVMALARAAASKQQDHVARLDAALRPMWALFRDFGSLRVVYAVANILGLTDMQPPRPILPLPAPVRTLIAGVLAALPD